MWHVASWWNLFLFVILLILSSIRNWFWSDNFFSHYTWYYQKRILWIKFKHCLTTLSLCLSIWTCIQVVWCLYSALWCVKICGLGVIITKCIFLFLCTHFLENPLHFVVLSWFFLLVIVSRWLSETMRNLFTILFYPFIILCKNIFVLVETTTNPEVIDDIIKVLLLSQISNNCKNSLIKNGAHEKSFKFPPKVYEDSWKKYSEIRR